MISSAVIFEVSNSLESENVYFIIPNSPSTGLSRHLLMTVHSVALPHPVHSVALPHPVHSVALHQPTTILY